MENSLALMSGKWKVSGIYIKTSIGWMLRRRFRKLIWEFMGNIMFIEQQDEEEYISEYMFYLEENKLFIDRRKYESDSANVILSSNLYEVDISENECWLYNLLDKDKKGYCRSKLRMESI